MIKILTNANIVSGGDIITDTDIIIDSGKITQLIPRGSNSYGEIIDLKGNFIAPGFIDIHCHGADGHEFIDGTTEAFEKVCALHKKHGTKIIYPTISATNYETLYKVLETAEKVINTLPVKIPGLHLEGPYLSKEMSGGQETHYITKPVKHDYEKLIDKFGDIIARWTYAPEEDNGDFLNYLNKNNIKASIGHSAAKYKDVLYAYNNSCNLITHLYSCTSTITREQGFRKLGIIETAYLIDEIYVEAIADGCHLPPELLNLIIKIKGTDKVCLITDAIRHAGMDNIENVEGGTNTLPYIIEDGVAKLADRSAFAGSIATTEDILKRTVNAGISIADTVKMMTEIPAKAMNLHNNGKIDVGYEALFTVFDSNLNIIDTDNNLSE